MPPLKQQRVGARASLTVVFTDIENSTALNRQLGDRGWTPLREEHFTIARKCIEDNGGRLVKTIGDSVMAVFEAAPAAVRFALDFQTALRAWNQKRPSRPAVPVRIGVHSGEMDTAGPDVFGNEVNRAARVESLAAGGQILVTDPVRRAIQSFLPGWINDIEWHDHGEVDLKGFSPERERVWEVLDGRAGQKPRKPGGPPKPVGPPPEELARARTAYFDKLDTLEFRLLNLRGFPDLRDKMPIELPRVFVMPRVRSLGGMEREREERRERKPPTASEIFSLDGGRLVFLGKPGAGKTTLLRYLGLSFVKPLPWAKDLGSHVPVYFEIRKLDKAVQKDPKLDLWAYFHDYCRDQLGLTLPDRFFETFMAGGQLLVLFDGLDEVASDARRGTLVELIARFSADLPEGNRVAVTSRVAAYWRTPLPPQDFQHFELLDFEEKEIRAFLGQWYEVREPNPQQVKKLADDLWKAIQQPSVRSIAGNPLILTMIALIHRAETKLPEGRALLYDKCTECLLDLWTAAKQDLEEIPELKGFALRDKRRVLGRIAYDAQLEAPGEQREAGVLIDQDRLARQLETFVRSEITSQQTGHVAEVLLNALRGRDGVLAEQQTGQFGFLHKTFQEYFAAWHIAENVSGVEDALGYVEKHIGDPFWHETLYLAVAKMGGGIQAEVLRETLRKGRVRFAWHCLQSGARADRWLDTLIRFLAQCYEEHGWSLPRLEDHLDVWQASPKVLPILRGVFEKENRDGNVVYPALLLLDALAERGSREAKDLRGYFLSEYPNRSASPAADNMAPVAAGPLPLGDTFRDGREGERPVTEVTLPGFWIDRFPVTNAEYERMIPGHKTQRGPYSQTDAQPVANVSWYEAALYCRWSGARLPTEAEWEKAAAWDAKEKRKRKYPWGNEWDASKCNCLEGERGATTPAGAYPDGASPYGCQDMAGNVWEWMSSPYRAYPYEEGQADEDAEAPTLRVVRGGSFGVGRRRVRTAYRRRNCPWSQRASLGFRRARTL